MEFSIGAVIGIAGASLVVGAVIMNFFYNKFLVKPAYSSGPKETVDLPIFNWFKILYYFLPYGLFLFGIIYDGLVRKVKFFPAGFVGLAAVYINSLGSRAVGGDYQDSDICGIPGMSKWGSDVAPQNIVFTSSVLSYIASYISASQSDSWYSGVAWIGVFVVWILQLIIFNVKKCSESKVWAFTYGSDGASKFIPPLIGLLSGMFWGGLAGYGFSYLQGDNSGLGISSEQKQSLTKSGPAMAPTSGTAGAGKCSPTDSDDAFVCEAYKNGELVTSTIVE